MYNTQPYISAQEVSISARTATSVRDCKLPSGSRLANCLGRWVQHRDGNERMTSDHS